MSTREMPNVILAPGGWADGSSWRAVIPLLQRRGINVVTAPLPLTTLDDDVEMLERTIERTEGPVVLAAHAYAGGVISSSQHPRVKALVFVPGFAPAEGETLSDLFFRNTPHPKAPHLVPDSHGRLWLPDSAFSEAFAQNASAELAGVLAATQRPLALACMQEPARTASWQSMPSWYLVAEDDRMIVKETQRFMADRMHATIRSHAVDHLALLTAPDVVAAIINDAVDATLSAALEVVK